MSEKQNEQWPEQIRIRMEQKTTEELLDIWKKNDRGEWTDAAFEVIREILAARIGSLPAQGEDIVDSEEKVDEALEDEDTYHVYENLVRVSSLARGFSWICLGLAVLFLVADIVLLLASVTGENQMGWGGFSLDRVWIPLMSSLLPLLFSGFFFVALRAIAEGIYVLLDIEDSTRRTTAILEKYLKGDAFFVAGEQDEE